MRTVCGTASAQNSIPACVLNCSDDRTRRGSAFNKDKLILQVGFNLLDTWMYENMV
jgi:hypothetical protein